MKSEDWMPKLDYLARKLGYEAAARTESAVVALVTSGADYNDIEVTDSEGSVYISLMTYGRDKHGRSMSGGSATIAGDHPAVRHLRPAGKEDHVVGVMTGDDRVSVGNAKIMGQAGDDDIEEAIKNCRKVPRHSHRRIESQDGGNDGIVCLPPEACQHRTDAHGGSICRLDSHGNDVPHEMAPEM